MSISKRVLTKWRKESLVLRDFMLRHDKVELPGVKQIELFERVLTLTQELIDQELLKEANNGR